MLSIFQTRFGCAVVAAAIAVIATFIMTARHYDQSLQVAALNKQVSELQAVTAKQAADLAISKLGESSALATADTLKQKATEDDTYIENLLSALADQAGRLSCPVDDFAYDRLHNAK